MENNTDSWHLDRCPYCGNEYYWLKIKTETCGSERCMVKKWMRGYENEPDNK